MWVTSQVSPLLSKILLKNQSTVHNITIHDLLWHILYYRTDFMHSSKDL